MSWLDRRCASFRSPRRGRNRVAHLRGGCRFRTGRSVGRRRGPGRGSLSRPDKQGRNCAHREAPSGIALGAARLSGPHPTALSMSDGYCVRKREDPFLRRRSRLSTRARPGGVDPAVEATTAAAGALGGDCPQLRQSAKSVNALLRRIGAAGEGRCDRSGRRDAADLVDSDGGEAWRVRRRRYDRRPTFP